MYTVAHMLHYRRCDCEVEPLLRTLLLSGLRPGVSKPPIALSWHDNVGSFSVKPPPSPKQLSILRSSLVFLVPFDSSNGIDWYQHEY